MLRKEPRILQTRCITSDDSLDGGLFFTFHPLHDLLKLRHRDDQGLDAEFKGVQVDVHEEICIFFLEVVDNLRELPLFGSDERPKHVELAVPANLLFQERYNKGNKFIMSAVINGNIGKWATLATVSNSNSLNSGKTSTDPMDLEWMEFGAPNFGEKPPVLRISALKRLR